MRFCCRKRESRPGKTYSLWDLLAFHASDALNIGIPMARFRKHPWLTATTACRLLFAEIWSSLQDLNLRPSVTTLASQTDGMSATDALSI